MYKIDFGRNFGGIENVEGFQYGCYQVGINSDGSFKTQKMLILSNYTSDGNTARFVTQRFDLEGKRHAVFVMEYFMDGEAATSIAIVQEDRFKDEVWLSSNKSGQWQKARVVITDVREPRFEIQANCSNDKLGMIAVSKISLKLCMCSNGCTNAL